mmetsp:Transcript_86928/g.137176  ORF Transcript_86928/g.137176 Transcript_86928/m.137176 type:complete len:200 (-) Transcript_86928:83-682(-)
MRSGKDDSCSFAQKANTVDKRSGEHCLPFDATASSTIARACDGSCAAKALTRREYVMSEMAPSCPRTNSSTDRARLQSPSRAHSPNIVCVASSVIGTSLRSGKISTSRRSLHASSTSCDTRCRGAWEGPSRENAFTGSESLSSRKCSNPLEKSPMRKDTFKHTTRERPVKGTCSTCTSLIKACTSSKLRTVNCIERNIS